MQWSTNSCCVTIRITKQIVQANLLVATKTDMKKPTNPNATYSWENLLKTLLIHSRKLHLCIVRDSWETLETLMSSAENRRAQLGFEIPLMQNNVFEETQLPNTARL